MSHLTTCISTSKGTSIAGIDSTVCSSHVQKNLAGKIGNCEIADSGQPLSINGVRWKQRWNVLDFVNRSILCNPFICRYWVQLLYDRGKWCLFFFLYVIVWSAKLRGSADTTIISITFSYSIIWHFKLYALVNVNSRIPPFRLPTLVIRWVLDFGGF